MDPLDVDVGGDAQTPGRGANRPGQERVVDQVEDGVEPRVAAVGGQDLLTTSPALGRELQLDGDPPPLGGDQQQVGIVQPLAAPWSGAPESDTQWLARG